MPGLLDMLSPEDQQAVRQQQMGGLLNALGQASMPTRAPIPIGAVLAQAAQGMNQGQQQGIDNVVGNRSKLMQMQQMQQQMDQQQKQRQFMQQFSGSLPEQIRPLADAFPEHVAKSVLESTFAKPENPFGKVDPEKFTPESVARFAQTRNYADLAPTNKESPLPWYVRKGPDGKVMIDPAYAEFEKMKAREGKASSPYYQFIGTPQGIAVGNARTGTMSLGGIGGAPVMKSSDSPALQGEIARAKEVGKTYGEETTKAALDAPRVVQNGELAIRLSNDLLSHPGFSQAVGKSSMFGVQKIHGTQAYDFMNRLDQIKGGAFLEAFNSLKGGGQITEVEGKKATDAIARMDNATSEGEFKSAVADFQDVVRKGVARAKAKASGATQQSNTGSGGWSIERQ